MPARRSPSHDRAARHDAVALPAPKPAAEPTADETLTDSAATTGDAATEDVPMNRAARRAKGNAAMQPRPVGKILPGRTNQSHGPRSYANRRSG